MKIDNIISRLTPGFVERAVMKSWMPFGENSSVTQSGFGAPVWLQSSQDGLIKEGFMGNPTVYMIVSYITRLAAQIPWVLYEVKDEKFLNRWKNIDPLDPIRASIYEKKALQMVQSHRIMEIWRQPNELQGHSEFMEQLLGFKLVTGETFMHGIAPETGPNAGLFTELNVLPANLIGIEYGSPSDPLKNYFWRGDPNKKIPKEVIMQCKNWNPLPYSAGGLHGMSRLQASIRLITRNNDSITASVKYLQNMGAVGMLSRYVGTAGDKGLSIEQANEIERKWYEKFGGAKNRGKIMVTGAAVKWQQMAMSPVDLKIIEQEKMDLRALCSVYALQSQLFNDPENKTYNNMKEATTSAYTQSVIPEMRSLRDELNRFWIQPWGEKTGKKLWFDMDLQAIPELQTNLKELMDWLDKAEMLTPDEKRAVIEYEQLGTPGMDQIWQDQSKITMEQALMDVDSVDKHINDTSL